MTLIFIFLLFGLFAWYSFWSSQAGRSMASINAKLDDWQDIKKWFSKIPEAVIGMTFGLISVWGVYRLSGYYDWGLSGWWSIPLWAIMSFISFIGKESATFAYLKWVSHTPDNPDRDSTTREWNDWVAARLGYKYGDEGYSWIWAATKGFVTTLPNGSIGLITQPIGREIASHAKKIGLPFERNFWMEWFGDAFGYATASFIFINIILRVTS